MTVGQLTGSEQLTRVDEAAIRAEIERYRRAVLDGDWDAWANTLADDVFASSGNRPPMIGRAAALDWVRAFPKITDFAVEVEEIGGRGPIAYARGSYTLGMVLPDGAPVHDHGSFLEIHQRADDGRWPYTHLMFHSTEPVPMP